MAEKVTLPKEVAEELESLRKNNSIFRVAALFELKSYETPYTDEWAYTVSRKNMILEALVNGYETEPEYVSFEKAMLALQTGKKVKWHDPTDLTDSIKIDRFESLDKLDNVTFEDLFCGKWTIEGDPK